MKDQGHLKEREVKGQGQLRDKGVIGQGHLKKIGRTEIDQKHKIRGKIVEISPSQMIQTLTEEERTDHMKKKGQDLKNEEGEQEALVQVIKLFRFPGSSLKCNMVDPLYDHSICSQIF